LVGRKLAHYEILEPLGVGGIGLEYRARGAIGRFEMLVGNLA